jgi:DNA-binding HxlR family transcriptional regulator
MEKKLTVTFNGGSLRFTIIFFEIIDYLRRKHYAPQEWIKKDIRGSNKYLSQALKHLVSIGIIDRSGTGTAGDCYWYALTEEWDAI